MSRSGLDGWRALANDGGHGLRKLLAETWLAEGALLDEFGQRKVLTVVRPGMITFSATREYHIGMGNLEVGPTKEVSLSSVCGVLQRQSPPRLYDPGTLCGRHLGDRW
jgi:hypothetical protein